MPNQAVVSKWDIIALCGYFLLVLVVGFYSMFRTNRGSISGYFLAGRFMTWLPIGASLFASNIGSEHFVGLAGSGAAAGIGVGAFELNALIILQILGWILLPVYIASGVHTLPEFMQKRFGGQRIQVYLAFLSLILYIFTKLSVNMYSGALFVQESLGWNIYFGMFLVLAITAICTVTGGLKAVIYTDTLQCFLMVFGAGGLAIYAYILVGGYSGLKEKYPNAIPSNLNVSLLNDTCGLPNPKAFQMLREPTDSDLPWPGFLLGQSPASIWYWGADQMIVQRALAAKSLSHAQGATIFAGYLKILPLFFIVIPGMISRVLFPDEIACIHDCEKICGNPMSCSNSAYPKLVVGLMPQGAMGAMLAVMLAALMSDLSSIFNSSATLFTMDIYRRLIRKQASSRELLIVGRGWVVVMVVISFFWVPIVQVMQGGQLYIYIQTVAAYLAPPIAAMYLLAILWKRCNEHGAFWGLIVGLLIGLTRMSLDFVYRQPKCGEMDRRPPFIASIHYMYFAMILFWLSAIVCVAISYLTAPLPEWMLIRTTYWTRTDCRQRPDEYTITVANEPLVDSAAKTTHRFEIDTDQLSRRSWLSRALRTSIQWICGLESNSEKIERLEHCRSLHQTKFEKYILVSNLIFIVVVAVTLYIYFSV